MWDKKGENLTYNWLKNLQNSLLKEQDFLGNRLSTAQLQKLSDEDLAKYAVSRAEKCNSMGYMSFGNTNKEKVKRLQQTLEKTGANIEDPEGTFGESTLKSVIAGQKKVGIRTDGCVGPETLSAFGLSLSDSEQKVDLPQEPMQDAVDGQAEVPIAEYTGKITPSKIQRPLDKITGIVLHDTLTSSLRGMIGAFSKPRTYTAKSGKEKTYYTGTHFSITADGKVRQHAPLAFPTNHTATGGWNSKSVGIDIVTRAGGTGAGYKGYTPPTPAQMEALYVLVSQLASKLPSLDKTVHWMGDAPKGGWKLGGKIFNIPSGIVSHGMVQGNRSDATFSSYYLKLRTQGMSHAEAFNKTREAEQAARLGQRAMVAENSFKYGENLTYKFFRLLREQDRPKLAVIVGDSQTGISGRILEKILKSNDYNVIRNFKASENTAKTVERLQNINPKSPVDLVVVFTGGNNPSATFSADRTEQLINTIREKYGNPQIIFGVAPPATKGDPAKIKKVFGRDSHSEKYSAKRDRIASAIAEKATSMGASFVDPREFMPDPSSITTGDGIHLIGQYAKEFASQIANKVDTSLQNTEVPKQVARSFTGSRIGTSELSQMDVKEIFKYAKSRSKACRGMGFLTVGSKGPRVEELHKLLKNKNYEITDDSGEFGENTLINVISFQKQAGIRIDGCVGPETAGALGLKQAFGGTSDETPEERAKIFSKEKKGTVKRYARLIRSIPSDEISYRYGDVPADMFPKVIEAIEAAAEKNGVDLDIMLAMAIYESGFNPYARTPLSSAAGLYAFLKGAGASYGLQNYPKGFYDPGANADAAARMINNNISTIEETTGRPMSADDEYLIYVAHQQGPAGMRNIYRSAQRGFPRATRNDVHGNIMNQGSYLRGIYMKGGPKAFLDFYKNKFSRTKSLGRQIANAVKAEQVAE